MGTVHPLHRQQGAAKLRSDNIRGVAPIAKRDLDAIFKMPLLGAREPGQTAPAVSAPDLSHAANDDLPPGAAIASEYGGRIGLGIMLLVAALIGAMLAVGGF